MEFVTKIDEIITDKTKVITIIGKDELCLGYSAKILYSGNLDSYVYYKPFSL